MNEPKYTGKETDAMIHPVTVLNAVEELRRQMATISPNSLTTTIKRRIGLEVEVTKSSDGLMLVVREPGHKYGTAVPKDIYEPWDNGKGGWYIPGTARADHSLISIDDLPIAELTPSGWIPYQRQELNK